VTQKRRNRYYRIASPLVARMLECIKAVAAIEVPQRHQPSSIADDRLRFARTCYDHLAGYLGVAIADALIAKGHIVLTDDGGEVTVTGMHFLSAFGAVLTAESRKPAHLLPPVPRLERAPLSRRRSRWRGDSSLLPGARLAEAGP
jgi:hypothetical protein